MSTQVPLKKALDPQTLQTGCSVAQHWASDFVNQSSRRWSWATPQRTLWTLVMNGKSAGWHGCKLSGCTTVSSKWWSEIPCSTAAVGQRLEIRLHRTSRQLTTDGLPSMQIASRKVATDLFVSTTLTLLNMNFALTFHPKSQADRHLILIHL